MSHLRITFFSAALCVAFCALRVLGADPIFPGEQWVSKSPQELGLGEEGLKAFSEAVGGFGCVVRHGQLAFGWGTIDKRKDVASCCKPWFTHFLFDALEQKKVASVDDKVVALEPRLDSLNAGLDHKDRQITWRHLANQTSCYGVGERPGEAYDYSDYNMALFYDMLLHGVWKTSSEQATADVLRPRLTDILQCQDQPRFDPRGRLSISPRDFCRFGLLYLHGGNWNGRQVLGREHVRTILTSPLDNRIPRTRNEKTEMIAEQRSLGGGSNQTDHLGSYSWAWWTNGVDREGQRHWPAVPVDTYAALGNFGKRALVVMPGLDLIVSWNDSQITTRAAEDHALGLLVKAVSEKAE
jgi:CubicO group peptidase (beta-lactamase class C family)